MYIILISILPLLVPLAIVLYFALHPVKCPDCGDTLPIFYSPFKRTRRMWRAGGYLCARCGCETNMAGQKVTADTPPAPFPTLQCALLAVGLLVGAGLAATLIRAGRAVAARPAPAAIAAPPVVDLPLQTPALAPVN
jgi:DNA-directed RNA polymerase subunit RPC12/RpoP